LRQKLRITRVEDNVESKAKFSVFEKVCKNKVSLRKPGENSYLEVE
jgi:hypothetical protein